MATKTEKKFPLQNNSDLKKGKSTKIKKIKSPKETEQKLNTQHVESDQEVSEGVIEIPDVVGTSINLSKKNLRVFPENLLDKMQTVQYLYLEGNKLNELPINLFQQSYLLKWLDLRNNNLVLLPTLGLKNHPSLEVILLQGNRIRILPSELASIATLKGLQITGNPITNVPQNIMAEGFQGIIKHLEKLNSLEEIGLSNTIALKPPTSKDETTVMTKSEITEPEESELRIWDLNKLSQWRQFMKKKSKKPKNPEFRSYEKKQDKADSEHAKLLPLMMATADLVAETFGKVFSPSTRRNSPENSISVSMRSHGYDSAPKLSRRPEPFRCGVYHKNRHKITSSGLHFMKLRKTRLGYKRKPITVAMIQEKAMKETYKTQIRETLEKQARNIQRMRDKEVLKSWREHAKITKQQLKLLDNYQQYPSKDFANKTPFDIDPEFLNMLNRVDLYRSLRDYDNRSKRNKKPKVRITALDLEKQMNDIMAKLQKLDTNDEGEHSPRTKQSHMCNKMHKILEIQKTLKSLQTMNSSMNGIMPIIKPKKTN